MEERKLAFYSKGLGIFRGLGMTTQQAKVYLSLSKLGQATVKTIAMAAQMDRAEVYRVIPALQKRGLVKKIITMPISFKAVPLSEGLKILLQEKAEKHEEICRQAEQILQNFKHLSREKTRQEEVKYSLTSGFKAESREFLKDITELQTSSDGVFYWRTFPFWLNLNSESYRKALTRGVKFRYITNIPEDEEMPQIVQTLKKTGSFELKSASIPPKVGIDILDKKDAHIITATKDDPNEIEVLRSSSPAIVALLQDYFDMKWQAATPCWNQKTIK